LLWLFLSVTTLTAGNIALPLLTDGWSTLLRYGGGLVLTVCIVMFLSTAASLLRARKVAASAAGADGNDPRS
jgi:hypothetical protein